jgi:hypothetical protein
MIDLEKRPAANPAGWAEIDRLRADRALLLAALKALAHVATWDDDTDRAEFDAAFALAEAAIAKAEART